MIVDDHALVRMGIRRLLDDVPTIEVVAEVESGEEALKTARLMQLDVVLLDMKMSGIDGLEVTKRMTRSHPNIKIIMLTALIDASFPGRMMQAGASGYLTKECGATEMVAAIEKVHKGGRYLSSEVAQAVALNQVSDSFGKESPFEILSERELQVTLMISRGMTVSEISKDLCLGSKTVNGYRYRIFSKLDLKNDVELVCLAIKYGLIEKPALVAEY